MKRVLAAIFAFALLIGLGATVQASLIQDNLSPVCFWVVDDTGDSNVTLDITNLFLSGTLKYSTDQSTWTAASNQESFTTSSANGRELVYWRLDNSGAPDYIADLSFQGFDHDDLWNAVIIFWDEGGSSQTEVTFAVPGDCDNVAPVPIPASVVLLGSGILGLIAIGCRRRTVKE